MKSLLGKTFSVTILKKARTIGEAFSATLSSNVFSRSRLASNQCLMNQIGNLVTLPGRGIKSGLNQEYHEKLSILLDRVIQVKRPLLCKAKARFFSAERVGPSFISKKGNISLYILFECVSKVVKNI